MARQNLRTPYSRNLTNLFSVGCSLQTFCVMAWPTETFISTPFVSGRRKGEKTTPILCPLLASEAPCKQAFAKRLPWETEEDYDESSLKSRLKTKANGRENKLFEGSTLAKLAVAFSPSNQRINLSNIEAVTLLKIDDDCVEIEALVCEDDSCVTLFIPVEFPTSCRGLQGDSEQEECIIENMEELQSVADGRIVQLEQGLELETMERTHPEWQLDTRRPTTQEVQEKLPSWWIIPEYANVPVSKFTPWIKECELLRSMLNSGDFDDEIKLLARDGLIFLENGELYEIENAVVADVGPAGFCLRARAFLKSDEGIPKKKRKRIIVELCLPFGGEAAADPKALRAKVLDAVAALSVY